MQAVLLIIEASPSGKAPGFGLGTPRFESLRLRLNLSGDM